MSYHFAGVSGYKYLIGSTLTNKSGGVYVIKDIRPYFDELYSRTDGLVGDSCEVVFEDGTTCSFRNFSEIVSKYGKPTEYKDGTQTENNKVT